MLAGARWKRLFRTSLAGLLFLMLLACGYFAGYRRGYLTGGQARRDQAYLIVYPVGDLTSSPQGVSQPPSMTPDELTALIQEAIAPESWKQAGKGEGELQWFAKNSSLIVSQTERVHEQVSLALSLLRIWRNPSAGEQTQRLTFNR
jgi:hypothetical protein